MRYAVPDTNLPGPSLTRPDFKNKRVALVLPDLRGGGAEQVALQLGRAFLDRGLEVDFVLVQAAGELLGERPAASRLVDLGAPRFRSAWLPLHRYLRRERPDCLLPSMWPLTAIACLAARTARIGCRVIASEHTDFRPALEVSATDRAILRRFGRWLYGPAHLVVAVSSGVRDGLRDCVGLGPDRTAVIHNPLRRPSGNLPDRDDLPLFEWWRSAGPSLLTVGNLKPQKAHDVLIRALPAMRAHPDARLIILGDGPLRTETAALVERLGLGDRVRLPGFRTDPFPFMEAADLFVLSSVWEGFGMVLIEALACGTPVVSTDCPSGPREVLADGAYGILTPPGDVEALAEAIDRALGQPADPDRLKRRAEDFSPDRVADAYLAQMFGTGERAGHTSS